jgi:hypothetical protein
MSGSVFLFQQITNPIAPTNLNKNTQCGIFVDSQRIYHTVILLDQILDLLNKQLPEWVNDFRILKQFKTILIGLHY